MEPAQTPVSVEALAEPAANLASFSALFVAGAVFLCFSPSLDNFFAGDDFSWLFQALKTIHHPLELLRPMNGFLRYTELCYFLVPLKLFGLSPFPFFLALVALHAVNAALVTELIARVSSSRLAGVAGGLFWGINYKHAEVVLRPYAVADSLALLCGLLCLLLVLRRHHLLAVLVLIPGLFAKENAVVFPLLAALMLWSLGRRWWPRTVGLFAAAGLFTAAALAVRARADRYLVVDWSLPSRFWEAWLTYLGPDASWRRQVVLDGAPALLPAWLACLLLVPFSWTVWRLPARPRFGVLWACVAMAPSLALQYQASRYTYVPLVGVAILFGVGLDRVLGVLTRRSWRPAAVAVWTLVGLLGCYLLLGVHHEEVDIHRHGELHRRAVASFQMDVAPGLDTSPGTTVLFVRSANLELARSLFPARPWYLPETHKWVFRRAYGVLGLANTYGFVSYCTYSEEAPALFVAVRPEELPARLDAGPVVVIFHDSDANRFSILDRATAAEVIGRARSEDLHELLQPGRFDPACEGDQAL